MVRSEIDALKILHNIHVLRAQFGNGVKFCAVLKGNAYGCGAEMIAHLLEAATAVDCIAVATLEEGCRLRATGIRLPILVLNDAADEEAARFVQNDLIPSICRLSFIDHLAEAARIQGKTAPFHVRVDVCDGSPGLSPEVFLGVWEKLGTMPHLEFAGLYTQLYGSYVDEPSFLSEQQECFDALVHMLPSALRQRLCVHAASTLAACVQPTSRYDMVRVGAGLFGLPMPGVSFAQALRPVITLRTRISDIKTVQGGMFAGYRLKSACDGTCRLAVMEGGYEDVFFLLLQKGGVVLVRGARAPFVGSASMDTCVIDVSQIPEAAIGDEVVLLGSRGDVQITVEEVLQWTGMSWSNCQLVMKTGRRVKQRLTHRSDQAWGELLTQVSEHCPTVRRALAGFGKQSLAAYITALAEFTPEMPLADPADVREVACRQLQPLIGEEAARQAAACLKDCALTANHHGVDYFAPSVQGDLLFRELLKERGIESACVPVIACSSVSMCNSSFGRGMLFYDVEGTAPVRLPIIPHKYEKSCLGFFPQMTQEMIERALVRLQTLPLSASVRQTAGHILRDIYAREDVLHLARYADQSCVIEQALSLEATGCGFAYIEAERLTADLILWDLAQPGSLVRLLFEDGTFRRTLYAALEGVPGCWRRSQFSLGRQAAGGTMLFWGRDVKDYHRAAMIDDGQAFVNTASGAQIPYAALSEALAQRQVHPGLFLIFLTLFFERGLHCFGGYFQPAYLRQMQIGLSKALAQTGRTALARVIDGRDASGYLSGPMFLACESGRTMGSVEMLADPDRCRVITPHLEISFEEAHRLGFLDLYKDTVPAARRLPDDMVALIAGRKGW